MDYCIKRKIVTIRAKTANHTDGNGDNVRMLAEGFASVDVGKMNFNNGKVHSRQGVPNRDACMRVTCGIDKDSVRPINIVTNDGDNIPFVVLSSMPRCEAISSRCALMSVIV